MPRRSALRVFLLTFGSLIAAIGFLTLVAAFSWNVLDDVARNQTARGGGSAFRYGSAMLVLGLLAVLSWYVMDNAVSPPEAEQDTVAWNRRRFRNCLVGLGFVMLVVATANVIALAGFAYAGIIDDIMPVVAPEGAERIPAARQTGVIGGVTLVTALGWSLLGALMFFTTSLWTKLQGGETFDPALFWAGLWFRLAEAVFFTLVIYAFLRISGIDQAERVVLVAAPFIGFSLKASEQLVQTLSDRVQAVLLAAVPKVGDGEPPPEVPIPYRTPVASDNENLKSALTDIAEVKDVSHAKAHKNDGATDIIILCDGRKRTVQQVENRFALHNIPVERVDQS